MQKLRKILFRLLILLVLYTCVSGYMHSRRATSYSAKATTPPAPFSELGGLAKAKSFFMGQPIPRPPLNREPAEVGLTVSKPLRFELQRGDVRGWVAEHPSPKGIFLMLPDYGASSDDLLEGGRILFDLGYHVATFDFTGAGNSAGTRTRLGAAEYREVEMAAERLERDYPNMPLLIYGRPMGSVAAMKAQYFGRLEPAAAIFEAPWNTLGEYAGSRMREAGMPEFFAHPILIMGGLTKRVNSYQFKVTSFASGAECPVLLLRGQDDKRVTADALSDLASFIPGDVSNGTIPGADHSMALSRKNPQAWQTEVKAFLATIPASAPVSTFAPTPTPAPFAPTPVPFTPIPAPLR